MKPITPIKIVKRGKAHWYINVPLHVRSEVGKARIFCRTKSQAVRQAATVEAIRSDYRAGFEMLGAEDRALLGRCVRLAGSAPALLKIAEAYKASHPQVEMTVTDLCQACLDAKKAAGLTAKYLNDSLGNTFSRFKEMFGYRKVATLTTADIEQWLKSSPWAQDTAWNHLKNIRTLLGFAKKRGLVEANVAESVETPKVTRKPPCILTTEDAERLMRAAVATDPELVPCIALILFGGLRPKEAQRCTPADCSATVIDLPASKTKLNKRRLVEFEQLPTLKAWLDRYPPCPVVNYARRMAEIRATIQPPIKWGQDILRHSFASYAARKFGLAEAGILGEHSEATLRKHYLERVTKSGAEKFWSIRPL